MADNTTYTPGSGITIATDEIASVHYPRTKIGWGVDGTYNDASASNPLPVTTGGLTDTQLRATAVPVSVSGTVTVTGGLTDTQLRATAVPVSGTFWQATQPVSASSLPLPTGAASETTVAALNTKTPNLGSATSANSRPVVIASDQATIPVNQAGVSATGSITTLNSNLTSGVATANSAVALSLTGASGWAVDVRGTFTGTITFQGSIDGTNWFSISMLPAGGGVNVAAVTTTTAVGAWTGSANGMQQVRATFSASPTGTATIVLRAMQAVGVVQNYPTGQTTQPVSGTVTSNIGTGTLAAVTSANLGIPGTIADVASAALATTTTTAAFTPTFGCSYEVNIPVTVVSGTNPTMDVVIQESDDAGTNWFDVYHFPRITAVGMYRSPRLPLTGNRVRYVQTVTGTTPSFTRAVNRLQSSDAVPMLRQIIDRTINVNSGNPSTASVVFQSCRNAQLVASFSAITTTAPAFQIEGSDDGGSNWYALGSPLTAVASSTVQLTVNNVHANLLRARVSTTGSGATLNYLVLKGF